MPSFRIVHADLYTLQVSPAAGGRVPEATVVVKDGVIAWVGPDGHAPKADVTIDARGRVVTPGWIDCHTHLVFAGERARDYRRRAEGASYKELAAESGGILSTVRATRAATEDALEQSAAERLVRFLARGVTTIEAKSGYGLGVEDELKILRAQKRAAARSAVEVESTFLGAHAIPPEFRDAPERYVDLIVAEMLPRIQEEGLARFCDVFVEGGFFTADQARRILGEASARGMKPKLHVDQMSAGGGAELAAELGAVSADHLEHASDAGLLALARAGTVAVLLPGASLFLGDELPHAQRFREAGLKIALSTDFNPGTSPTDDLALMGTLAMSRMGMTSEEALAAVTINAAAAIARPDLGLLAPGCQADLVLWDAPSLEHLFWHFGTPHAAMVFKRGNVVFERDTAPECRPKFPAN